MSHEIPQSPKPLLNLDLEKELNEKFRQKIEQLKKLPIVREAYNILEVLPQDPPLYYHDVEHTDDVLMEAVRLAIRDGLDDIKVTILGIAASWHDTGFMERYKDNEEYAVKFLFEAMQKIDTMDMVHMDKKELINILTVMIMDTKVKRTEEGLKIEKTEGSELSGYLLDADVSNFGKSNFFDKNKLIAKELGINIYSEKIEDKIKNLKFLESTLLLMKNHKWHTKGAELMEFKKKENMDNLKSKRDKLKREIKNLGGKVE